MSRSSSLPSRFSKPDLPNGRIDIRRNHVTVSALEPGMPAGASNATNRTRKERGEKIAFPYSLRLYEVTSKQTRILIRGQARPLLAIGFPANY